MKKLFTLLVAFVLSLTMMTSVSAIGLTPKEDESKLYIETAAVPSNVTSYAADIFMHMGKPVWANFGISDSQLSNLTLSQGFRMISVNTMQYSDIAYYFLIYAGNSVVAIMTISNVNGELGFQIERNLLTVDISEKLKNSAQPYRIYVSDNAYYFIQNNQIIHVSSDEYLYDKDRIADDCAVISNSIARSTDNVIDATITNISEPAASCSVNSNNDIYYSGDGCGIVPVNNVKYMLNENYGEYTCWASSIASLCYYYYHGCVDSYSENDISSASALRFEIIYERLADNKGSLTTNVEQTVPYINRRLSLYDYSLTYYCKNSKLSWNSIINSIGNDQPSLMGWFYYDSTTGKYKNGHIMVLAGYNYAEHDPSLEEYHMLLIRDSNTKPIITSTGYKLYPLSVVKYGSAYTINGTPNEWFNTVCTDLY